MNLSSTSLCLPRRRMASLTGSFICRGRCLSSCHLKSISGTGWLWRGLRFGSSFWWGIFHFCWGWTRKNSHLLCNLFSFWKARLKQIHLLSDSSLCKSVRARNLCQKCHQENLELTGYGYFCGRWGLAFSFGNRLLLAYWLDLADIFWGSLWAPRRMLVLKGTFIRAIPHQARTTISLQRLRRQRRLF